MFDLVRIARDLAREVEGLRFPAPVAYVYDPLVYARRPFEAYLERYGRGRKEAILVGMNPGPFGMCQTGIPFGDVGMVRDWLGIDASAGAVGRPAREHPKRPVRGFSCPRSEVSGRRLWSWARDRFGTPERFFARFLVWNHCPLCFVAEGGANVTPDRLPVRARDRLLEACDRALRRVVEVARPRAVVGVGRFAEGRARIALAGLDIDGKIDVHGMPHPSPANPAANRGGGDAWARAATDALRRAGIAVP